MGRIHKKKASLFEHDERATMRIIRPSSSCSTLVLLSSYELEAGASSFICHVMFMMRYIHHSCRTVGGWQRHCRGVAAFSWEIWKGWNGGVRFILCFAWPGIPLLLMSFFFFLFPRFLFPLVFQPYGLAAEVVDPFGLLSFLFWFEGARWEVERSINRHI